MKVFIIAEAGVNHNGDLGLALKLCDVAKTAGVDAVKFQTFKTENILTKNVPMASYQKKNLQSNINQFDMIKSLELSFGDFVKIKKHCGKLGIEFMSTPDDDESLDFLVKLGLKKIKIGSGDVNNISFLRKVGAKKLDVIMSTGMSTVSDIGKAYKTLISSGARSVSILHCTTNYPCPMEEVNLKVLLDLQRKFKTKIGYSDHTTGIEVAISAVALGATIIEKHFTLDKNMVGPDHKASLDVDELRQMVYQIRNIEKALGNGIKRITKSEIRISKLVRKNLVALRYIKKGEKFTNKNVTTKRANGGISARDWDKVIGKTARKDFREDEIIKL